MDLSFSDKHREQCRILPSVARRQWFGSNMELWKISTTEVVCRLRKNNQNNEMAGVAGKTEPVSVLEASSVDAAVVAVEWRPVAEQLLVPAHGTESNTSVLKLIKKY
ncbi:hypothetical protein V3C99_001123 [Haemonchus contortus]